MTHINMSFEEFTTQVALGTIKWYTQREYERDDNNNGHRFDSVQYYAMKSKVKDIQMWIASHKKLNGDIAEYLCVNDYLYPEVLEKIMSRPVVRLTAMGIDLTIVHRKFIEMYKSGRIEIRASKSKK